MSASLAERIDAALPQTQCGQCGYAGCRPYADAIARGDDAINRCPPGGAEGILALARLLDRPVLPLDPANGVEAPRSLAVVDEAVCIGCTKCIQACPVDAIVGAAKRMHAVIADECSGCGLCIPPCPVDCIAMVRAPDAAFDTRATLLARAAHYRARIAAREARLARPRVPRATRGDAHAAPAASVAMGKSAVLAAIARAKARRDAAKPG